MYYKNIELYNYAGIYNGMGLDHICIDFTKCISNKIIIRGSNGSGKSTLINALQPIPDNNSSFINGLEARKNLTLVSNNTEYIIRYIHPVTNSGRGTTKGYIAKTVNGTLVELNPSGNISSCKEILYDELDLDDSFIALSKLSIEDRGLVEYRPSERKKLLSALMSDLDTFNTIYKTLSKKASTIKSFINSITGKIDHLGNQQQLESALANHDTRLKLLEDEKATTIEAIAVVKMRISEYMDILAENNYDEICSELISITKSNNSMINSITNSLKNMGISSGMNELSSFLDFINSQIIELRASIDADRSIVPSLLTQRESESKIISEKQIKLNSLQSDYNYNSIKSSLESLKQKKEYYEEIFNQMHLANINLITKDEFNKAMDTLRYILESARALTSNYDISDIAYVINNRQEVISIIGSLSSSRTRLSESNSKLRELSDDIHIYEANRTIIAQLSKRPAECTIDSCPYIESAINASKQYPQEVYNNMIMTRDAMANDIAELETIISKGELYADIIRYVSAIERELKSNMVFINKLPVRSDFQETFLTRVLSLDQFRDIEDLYQYIDCGNMIEEYKVTCKTYSDMLAEYSKYESRNIIIESIIDDIRILMEKTSGLSEQINTLTKSIEGKESRLTELQSQFSKVKDINDRINNILNPSLDRAKELASITQALDVNNEAIKPLQDNLNQLNISLGAVNRDIENLTKMKNQVAQSLSLLETYKKELNEYNTKYTVIDKVRYYASPSTGIQTVFMNLYMNTIINTANSLLSLLFEGEFVLQPFIINESEFRIPCTGNGLMHDDISSMSTAQKCVISIILSFALLSRASSKYNIIRLDEADGTLDTNNRGYFITLLDNIMNMMRCEQSFIISHNSELDTTYTDLIVLKDGDNGYYNGNIIWKY